MQFKKSSISLKRLLTLSTVILVVLTGVIIAVISYISSRDLGYSMAASIIHENTQKVTDRVQNYLDTTYENNNLIEFLIKVGNLDPGSKEMYQLFNYYLSNNSEYAGIYYANIKGDFDYLKKMDNSTISSRKIENRNGVNYSTWIHEDESYRGRGFENSVYPSQLGYDPHTRTWYKGAINKKDNFWSEIYRFASDDKPGITNSQPVYKDGSLVGVLGIDLALSNISSYLKRLDLASYGALVILNKDNSIIASSSDFITKEHINMSYNYFNSNKNNKSLTLVNYSNENYIVNFAEFNKGENISWKIGIIFPQDFILNKVHSSSRFIIAIAIVLILLSTIIGLKLSKDISTPINLICSDMKKICNLDLEGDITISSELKEIKEIDQSFINLKKGIKSFSKYVPAKLVARLFKMGREAVLGGERRVLTVMFTDIVDFTTISEKMDPETLVEELAEYLENISKIIHLNSGTVDKYIGDSIMAFWNAPEDVNGHAALACNTAVQIQKYLDEFKINNPYKVFFPTRIGINTGEVLVGNIGCKDRMNYTVMGDNINLGCRLERLNRTYGTKILISKNTKEMSGEAFTTRAIDKVKVKGRKEETFIYELIGYNNQMTPDLNHFLNLYNSGVGYYFKLYFDESVKYLNDCLELNPADIPTRELLKKVEELKSRST